MKLTIEIEIGNEAMQTGADLARAVKGVAKSIDNIFEGGEPISHSLIAGSNIRDENGNRVGGWTID